MHRVLEDIVQRTREQVEVEKRVRPAAELEPAPEAPRPFRARIEAAHPAVIAEIKIASPSHPRLGSLDEAVGRAAAYEEAGADAVSFITERHYFKSDGAYIARLKSATNLPVLQKDFVVDEYQVYQARALGSDALLLITRLIDAGMLGTLVTLTRELGMEPVVEINSEGDLEKALATDTAVVAVNARDLSTFEVDVARACRLLERLPGHLVRLGFSGIESAEQVRQYEAAGANGVLVGTSLMQAADPRAFIRDLRP
ncbi:MAG TPA: indole-3-glycerol phosphate synthase TrpC [Candidatus Saccharimonadia bacterium]|jgi:indole-3-glycerol phosphate synthase|nr:indole-3-glycerol phosphate synthase TrpC [Candidatus Saccharimonadia bacterium]